MYRYVLYCIGKNFVEKTEVSNGNNTRAGSPLNELLGESLGESLGGFKQSK